jgi:uncharacterized protein
MPPALQSDFDTSLWEKSLDEEYCRREQERLRVLAEVKDRMAAFFPGKRVKAVYLTGSLFQEGKFYGFSDVDIAVEGLEEDYFSTLAALEDLLNRQVDLIELESCRFGQAIRESGLRIL